MNEQGSWVFKGVLIFPSGLSSKKNLSISVLSRRDKKTSLVPVKGIMGFKGFALEEGQKHKSRSDVFSLISCNY